MTSNIDTFIGELQRASRWNAYGALAASIAALCAAYTFARQQHWF
jgi:flagellar biosynthesis/type III secretory pathway M-ring protein FliF/YscJ